jgi:flagellar biosynthesis chaperone FliJ
MGKLEISQQKWYKSATDKPKTTATKLSVIRTFLKYNNKIDKNTTYEICKQFQASLKNLELSPEQIAKDKIKKSLKGLSVEQLNEINAFISQI